MEWSTLSLITAILALILHYLWKLGTSGFDTFEKQGIPFLKPFPFIGTNGPLLGRRVTMAEFVNGACNKFPGAKIVGLFHLKQPIYLVNDPELVKQIGVKDFEHFLDRKMTVDSEIDPLIGNNLSNLSGQKWKDMRSTLSPAFTGSKMRQMFDLLPEIGIQMVDYFKSVSDAERIVEMKDVLGRFALDAIATTNFGVRVNSLKEKENSFYLRTKNMLDFTAFISSLRFLVAFSMPWLSKILRLKLVPPHKVQFFIDLVKETEKTRTAHGIVRPDVVHLLMQIKKGQLKQEEHVADESIGFATVQEADLGKITKRNWTDEELMSQAFVFFFAGFETVSLVGSFTAYELALNQGVQKKLIQEIDQVHDALQGKELTYEVLQNMKYMDMVVSEGLRLWTPADFVDRKCVKDYKFKNDNGNEITITKGSTVWFAFCHIHSSEKYYSDPKKFNPERFSDENKHSIPSGAYLPFGIGPRNCIGSRFALMELKALFYYLLKDFTFEKTDKTQVPLEIAKGITNGKRSIKGVWLKLTPRKKTDEPPM